MHLRVVSLYLLSIVLGGVSGWAQESVRSEGLTADEQHVWRLEEDYWKYVKANDLKSYLTLWDERFVGWPQSSPLPAGKANITDWIKALRADPSRAVDFELRRAAVRSFGDVVVTHLAVWTIFRDVKTGKELERIPDRLTHTWQRRGNSWQIITGMSAPYLGPK